MVRMKAMRESIKTLSPPTATTTTTKPMLTTTTTAQKRITTTYRDSQRTESDSEGRYVRY